MEYLLFGIILISNWAMDSLRFRYSQSIFNRWRWLRETRFFGYREFWRSDKEALLRRFKNHDPAQGRKKILGITIPQAFFDGWHFWKSIMVTAICALAAANLVVFLVLGAAWLLVWWLLYDINYKTR